MKRFLLKVLLYIALTVGVIGGLCAWEIGAEILAYRRELVAPEGASILLCGDSQFGNAVDPAVAPAFFNFSAHGRALDQSYLIMRDALRANRGRIRTAIVDVSPAAATWPLDEPIEKMTFSGNYWLIHYLHPAENTRDLSHGLSVVRDCLVGRRLRLAWRAIRGKVEFHSSIYGHFTPEAEQNKAMNPALYEGLLRQKAELTDGAWNITDDALMFVFLEKMRVLAAEEGVTFKVVTTPWHRDLITRCGEANLDRFVAKLSSWCAAHAVPYVSFLKNAYPEPCWRDANHLNVAGARFFTPQLLESVR